MVRVRVQRIESIRDPEGNFGKKIELVEERSLPKFPIRPPSEEAKIIQDVMQVLQQQFPFIKTQTRLSVPKIILFLTEEEYERLGIDFDVNQIYEIELKNQSITFKKSE